MHNPAIQCIFGVLNHFNNGNGVPTLPLEVTLGQKLGGESGQRRRPSGLETIAVVAFLAEKRKSDCCDVCPTAATPTESLATDKVMAIASRKQLLWCTATN